jgi:hypothetical protein
VSVFASAFDHAASGLHKFAQGLAIGAGFLVGILSDLIGTYGGA